MKIAEISARWIAETERVICLIENEFIPLNEAQLMYQVHVGQCNIRQLLQQTAKINARLIALIEPSIRLAKVIVTDQEYKPGLFERIILNKAVHARCSKGKHKSNLAQSFEKQTGLIMSEIINQQHKVKALIVHCNHLDMNVRVVPFGLSGIIKLSIAGALEYLILAQKSRFIKARHILMLQSS